MNHKQLLLTYVILLFGAFVSVAQNPIATLEHGGASKIFSGQGSLVEAYNASANGDRIYLSTGFFTPPPAIAKGIEITGAGHFPDSANVARRTFIMGGLQINKGADSLKLQGLYINGDINYDRDNSINYVSVIRCLLGNANFNSPSPLTNKNNCLYEDCFITGALHVYYGNNFKVKHCLINQYIGEVYSSSLIDGNIFFHPMDNLGTIYSSVIRNNIFLEDRNPYIFTNNGSTGNSIYNNVFVISNVNWGSNSSSDNYFGIPQSDIFVNQTGNSIDYTHIYHLKNPEKYIGTDGTQVGIYGGTTPFKEKGLPSNPQIIKKTIAEQTDANGNLKVDVTVKAQEY
jgi:hypothetical protein